MQITYADNSQYSFLDRNNKEKAMSDKRMELAGRSLTYTHHLKHLANKKRIPSTIVGWETGARHISLYLELLDSLKLDDALKLAEPLALQSNTAIVIAQRLDGLISFQFQLGQGQWQSCTRNDLTSNLAIGLAEANREVCFDFDHPHSLIAGSTKVSGKTETVKSILVGLCSEYTPGDLGLVVIDPHHDYEHFRDLAHLVTPIATDDDEIDHSLLVVEKELAHRRDRNIRDGKRFVVVIDEAEDVLTGKRLAIAQRVGREARKFQMNLIIASQSPTKSTLPKLVNNCTNRWIGLVDDANTSRYLAGHAGLECHKLTGRGDFVHIAGATQDRLLVAMATQSDYDRLEKREVELPELPQEDTSRIIDEPPEEDNRGGRPTNDIEPETLAYYVAYYDKISIQQAGQKLGIKRHTHNRYKDFTERFKAKLIQIQKAERNGEKWQK